MDYREIFNPIAGLYVPDGWCIDKNHIFFLDKEGFCKIKKESDLFLAKEFFLSECVFYAKSEQPISTTSSLVGVVDAGCELLDMEGFLLEYKINFWLYKKRKKNTDLIREDKYTSNEPKKALAIISSVMERFSHKKFLEIREAR